MKVETILQRLDLEQAKLATEALKCPSGKESFDYGRAVGLYAGIEHAKRTIVEMLAEKEKRDIIL